MCKTAMMITKELAEQLNPEGAKLSSAQWQARLKKYEDSLATKEALAKDVGERPGVCSCGHSTFRLKVIPHTGGKIERTCAKCKETKIV
jgi:hypothetical protein